MVRRSLTGVERNARKTKQKNPTQTNKHTKNPTQTTEKDKLRKEDHKFINNLGYIF